MNSKLNEWVSGLMDMVEKDPCLGPSHISLYLALLHCYRMQGYRLPISVFSRELARQAKISARTYHKCLADLVSNGYVRYKPSYDPSHGSLVYINDFEK